MSRFFRTVACLLGLAAFAGKANAASIQISLQNIAPAESLGLELFFQADPGLDVSNIILTSTSGGMESLPQFTVALGATTSASMFPTLPGSFALPTLLPGDSVSFTVSGLDLLAVNTLQLGGTLFSSYSFADAAGMVTEFTTNIPASSLAEFTTGASPQLILPDSNSLGPISIVPNTPLLQVSVVPEPSVSLLAMTCLLGCLRRQRLGRK